MNKKIDKKKKRRQKPVPSEPIKNTQHTPFLLFLRKIEKNKLRNINYHFDVKLILLLIDIVVLC